MPNDYLGREAPPLGYPAVSGTTTVAQPFAGGEPIGAARRESGVTERAQTTTFAHSLSRFP